MSGRATFDPPLDADQYLFCMPLRARFAETDAMGIVHHAAYLPYFEAARVEWLRHIQHDYVGLRAQGVQFPVVEVCVRYLKPSVFDDLLTIHVTIAPATRATFQIGYLLTHEAEPRATAVTVHGCCDAEGRARRLPGWLLGLLDQQSHFRKDT